MRGDIYLIGGGEISKGETEAIDVLIKSSARPGSSLVFFPTAAGDSQGYIDAIVAVFGDIFAVVSATKDKGREFAEKSLETASVIYLGGGETQLLLDLFEGWNLIPILRGALDRGATIVGMSAGAQALCSAYIEYGTDKSMGVRRGWGIVPFSCLVHARSEFLEEAVGLYDASNEFYDRPFVAIGKAQHGMWAVWTKRGRWGAGIFGFREKGLLTTIQHWYSF
jgi:dipeptidase E